MVAIVNIIMSFRVRKIQAGIFARLDNYRLIACQKQG